MRAAVFTLMTAVAIALSNGPAWAFLTTNGTGAAAARAASVPRPTSVVATQTGEGVVHIEWNEASTALPVTQYVRRSSSASSTIVCTTDGSARSCDDVTVPSGTFTYTVENAYRTWSATSDPSSTITVVDRVPTVTAFTRVDAATTNAASVSWTLVLSEPVHGLTASNLSLASNGLTGATITSVIGSGSAWTIRASTGTGTGPLSVSLVNSTGVTDSTGNTVVVPVSSESYTIRPFFPTVLTLANGGSNNRIDAGDTITIKFSTALDQSTLCGVWTGTTDKSSSSASVIVIDGGAGNDSLSFALPTCPTLRLGAIALGAPSYVSAGNAAFTASISYIDSTRTITVTLGAKSGAGTLGTAGGSPTATFTPDPALLATSGVAAVGTVSSSGRF
jgi:hypothetical protein